MTRESQKQTEIFYAKSFAKDNHFEWDVRIPPNEETWPDLLIETPKDNFGLEVLGLYVDENRKGSTKKQDESIRQGLLRELSSRYYAERNIPIRLNLSGALDKKSLDNILDYLFSAKLPEWEIIEKEIQIGQNKIWLNVRRLPSSFKKYDRWFFVDDNLGWVRRLTDEIIESKVKEKNQNIARYKKNIAEVSLLIVSDRNYNSGRYYLEPSRDIETLGFKNVYVYMYPLESIIYKSD